MLLFSVGSTAFLPVQVCHLALPDLRGCVRPRGTWPGALGLDTFKRHVSATPFINSFTCI